MTPELERIATRRAAADRCRVAMENYLAQLSDEQLMETVTALVRGLVYEGSPSAVLAKIAELGGTNNFSGFVLYATMIALQGEAESRERQKENQIN